MRFKSDSHLIINTVNTTYTLTMNDDGNMVDVNSSSAVTITVPTAISVPFPIGASIVVRQKGAGQVTLAPADGTVVLNSANGLKLTAQYAMASLVKIAAGTWAVTGSLGA